MVAALFGQDNAWEREKVTLDGAASPFFLVTIPSYAKKTKEKACRIRRHALIDIRASLDILIFGADPFRADRFSIFIISFEYLI